MSSESWRKASYDSEGVFLTSRQNVLESPKALFVWPEQEGLVQIPGIASGLVAHRSKINTPEAVAGRKEKCFNQKSQQSGERRWTHVPRPTLKILLSHDSV